MCGFINIDLLLSAGYTHLPSLCIPLKDKSPASSKAYGLKHKVPANDDLFKGNVRKTTPELVHPASSCSLPKTNTPLTDYPEKTNSLPIADTKDPPVDKTLPKSDVPTKEPTEKYKQGCKKHCEKIFKDLDCKTLLSKAAHIEMCIADTISSGLIEFAQRTLEDFNRKCASLTNAKLATEKDKDKKEEIKAIQKDLGLNDNKCKKECSNNGVCLSCGCKCNPGYLGPDCSIKRQELVTYDPKTQDYAENVPPSIDEALPALLPPAPKKEAAPYAMPLEIVEPAVGPPELPAADQYVAPANTANPVPKTEPITNPPAINPPVINEPVETNSLSTSSEPPAPDSAPDPPAGKPVSDYASVPSMDPIISSAITSVAGISCLMLAVFTL